MPKVGGRRKKNRSHKQPDLRDEMDLPKTFVFKKGNCTQHLKQLVGDLRKCFYPNTSMKLQDTNKMAIKSYLKAAKYYHVNHLVILQSMNGREYIRFIKVGGGQMTFRIMNFSRMKDILQHGGQPFSYSFKESLLVLNGFGETQQVKMIGKGLQQLFPSLNLQKAKTEHLKRVISFSYRPSKKFIFFRQYKIIQHEGGVSNSFQKLMEKPKDLSGYKSLRQYLQSQSSEVQGTQNQQKLNLVEIGPRLKLKFVSYKQTSGVLSQQDLQDVQNDYVQREKRSAKTKAKRSKFQKVQEQNEQVNQLQSEQNQIEEEQEKAEEQQEIELESEDQ